MNTEFVMPQFRCMMLVLRILEILESKSEDVDHLGQLRGHEVFEGVTVKHLGEATTYAVDNGLVIEKPFKVEQHCTIHISELGHLVLHLSRQQAGWREDWTGD